MRVLRYALALFLLIALAGALLAGFRGASYKVRKTASRDKHNKEAIVSVVEFEVTADEPFPARALDPVLHVGDVEVRDYRYRDIENKTLIFTCFEPDKLADGTLVYLQYENDESTRTDLPVFRRSMLGGGS